MPEPLKFPLLLTASVDTRGMNGAMFSSVEREKMYVDTLNFYIDTLSSRYSEVKIVFAENSGWNLEDIKKKLTKKDNVEIEFVGLSPEMFDQSKGKSYNEMLMMDKAVETSALLRQSKGFFKLTGRFALKNIDRIIGELERRGGEGLAFFGDCKDHNVYDRLHMKINGHSGESRFYYVSKNFYDQWFVGRYATMNDYEEKTVEAWLLEVMRSNRRRKDVVVRLRTQSHFTGKGAHSLGKGLAFFYSTDNDSPALTFKRRLRQVFRWVFPFWWC